MRFQWPTWFFQDWSIDYWLDMGISKNKLVVGLPTYGMTFTLANPTENGVKAPAAGGGRPGDYTKETGILSYYEVSFNLAVLNILIGLRFFLPILWSVKHVGLYFYLNFHFQ